MAIRIRILPVLVFVATLMLVAKVTNVWHDISTDHHTRLLAPDTALAQEPSPGDGSPALRADIVIDENDNVTTSAGLQPLTLQADDAGLSGLAGFENTDGATAGEVRLLYSLADRRRRMIAQGRELVERESLLRAAEKQLEIKQGQLNQIKTDIEALVARYERQKDEENQRLKLIYTNMKPKDAAQIFNELDTDTLIGVLQDMNPRIVAPMIAEMNVAKARQLTEELAQRRAIDNLALQDVGDSSPIQVQ